MADRLICSTTLPSLSLRQGVRGTVEVFHAYLHRAASDCDRQQSLQRRTSFSGCAPSVLVLVTATSWKSLDDILPILTSVRKGGRCRRSSASSRKMDSSLCRGELCGGLARGTASCVLMEIWQRRLLSARLSSATQRVDDQVENGGCNGNSSLDCSRISPSG